MKAVKITQETFEAVANNTMLYPSRTGYSDFLSADSTFPVEYNTTNTQWCYEVAHIKTSNTEVATYLYYGSSRLGYGFFDVKTFTLSDWLKIHDGGYFFLDGDYEDINSWNLRMDSACYTQEIEINDPQYWCNIDDQTALASYTNTNILNITERELRKFKSISLSLTDSDVTPTDNCFRYAGIRNGTNTAFKFECPFWYNLAEKKNNVLTPGFVGKGCILSTTGSLGNFGTATTEGDSKITAIMPPGSIVYWWSDENNNIKTALYEMISDTGSEVITITLTALS